MNCITDFLPDDTSEHNADGENMDEIVFGIQPAPETLTPSELDAAIYGTSEYWQQMSSASIEAHTETLERVKELEIENDLFLQSIANRDADVFRLEAEIARLRTALENIAKFHPKDSEKPADNVSTEEWYSLPFEVRRMANIYYDYGLSLARWEAAVIAHKALK